MKFSCDDCGAQYMIADEKIGTRGVKVRCKKCAHVIILRPDHAGSSPTGDEEIAEAAPRRSSGPPPPPPPDFDDDEATIAREEMPSIHPLTSSEFGLSKEFEAMGFEETRASKSKPDDDQAVTKGISIDVDLLNTRRLETLRSPFGESMTAGGSLGAMVQEESNDEEVAQTRADYLPDLAQALGEAAGAQDESRDENEVATRVEQSPTRPSLEAEPQIGAFGVFDSIETGRVSYPGPAYANEETSKLPELPSLAELVSMNLKESDDEDEAKTVARSDQLEIDPKSNGNGSLRSYEPASRGTSSPEPSFNSLKKHAPTTTKDGLAHGSMMAAMGEGLEHEIGNALDAVFGTPSSAASYAVPQSSSHDPFSALVDVAGDALDSTGLTGEGSAAKKPKETRVFDTEAMRMLQDEQDLAGIAGHDDEPEETVVGELPREWYIAISDEQVGPLTYQEVKDRWNSQEVDANSLCWKQGMADWIAIRFVKELEHLTESEPRAESRSSTSVDKRKVVTQEGPAQSAFVRAKETIDPPSSSSSRRVSAIPAEDPLVNVPGEPGVPEDEESSWRPSAASALAALAASEFDAPKKEPVFESTPGLPGRRDEVLSNLLDSSEKKSASIFGAGDYTTRYQALPKAPDVLAQVPLRDPLGGRDKKNPVLMIAAAVISTLLLVLVVMVAISLFSGSKEPERAAIARTEKSPVETGAPATEKTPPPPAPNTEAKAETPPPEASPSAVAAAAAGDAPKAAESGVATEEAKAEEAAAPSSAPKDVKETPKAKTAEPRRSPSPRAASPERSRRPPPEPARATAPDPTPAPRSAGTSLEDDLIGNAGRRNKGPAAEAPPARPERLDDEDILRVLRKNKDEINECRNKQRKADASLEGVMTMEFVILPDGRTSQHTAQPAKFKSSVVGQCVVSAVKRWRFPSFSGKPLPVNFPVVLRGG